MQTFVIKTFSILALSLTLFLSEIKGQDKLSFSPFAKVTHSIEQIQKEWNKDTTICEFQEDIQRIYSLSIDAEVTLINEYSLVRIVLVDEKNDEYLIFEAFPLLFPDKKTIVKNYCEETALLNGIKAKSIKAYFIEASITIDCVHLATTPPPKFNYNNQRIKIVYRQCSEKAKLLNTGIKNKGWDWIAGETSLARTPYRIKKMIFGKKYNIQGFDFHKDGVFKYVDESTFLSENQIKTTSTVIDSFDWRNRHGATRELLADGSPNPYYDGDIYKGGWLTSVKNQDGCWLNGELDTSLDEATCIQLGGEFRKSGACWAFAAVGAMEAQINLYYNQHLDINLSEQMLVDCRGGDGEIVELSGKKLCDYYSCSSDYTYCKIKKAGIVDENCDPFNAEIVLSGPDTSCCDYDHICSDWQNRVWRCDNFHDFKGNDDFGTPNCTHQTINMSVDDFKRALIQYGPMKFLTDGAPGHEMVICGFKLNSSGATEWLFKNSYGYNNDNDLNGYKYIELSPGNLADLFGSVPLYPFYPPVGQSYSVRCLDTDGDGFYNWGIGEKPENCPPCSDFKDGDDSNPNLGPMDENGYCAAICSPIVISSNTTWNTNQYPCGNLIIDSGTLTINANSTVNMKDFASIIIKSGGKLFLDSATILNADIIALSGSELIIHNDGQIRLSEKGELDIKQNAILDYEYGTIDLQN